MTSHELTLEPETVRVVLTASQFAEQHGIALDNYTLHICPDGEALEVSFFDRGKPVSYHGSRPGYPQPVLRVDPASGQLLAFHFTR